MLLRLLPAPSQANPTPATILFTLPMTVNPYTGKNLPLPNNLLSHRSLCQQEAIECSNPLLGDKATWISGIVDETTFCLQTEQITAHLVDGSSVALPVSSNCRHMLHAVIEQVQLSFAPAPKKAATAPVAGPSKRSTPSNLLLSLLSPLLTQPTSYGKSANANAVNPSRLHRRQARSLLVDAYRRYVLPALKEVLPESFLLWTIQGELEHKQSEWESLRSQVDATISRFGLTSGTIGKANMNRSRSLGMSVDAYGASASSLSGHSSNSDDSSNADSPPPSTPATSVWNSPMISMSPLSHISSLPATSLIPASERTAYSTMISRLASLASRLSTLRKLESHIKREEGRKRWLEGMEASRMAEKATRRAWSVKNQSFGVIGDASTSRPLQRSPLRTVMSAAPPQDYFMHPAMESSSDEEDDTASISSESSSSPDMELVTPGEDCTTGNASSVPSLIVSRSDDSISSCSSSESDCQPEYSIPAVRRRSRTEMIWGVDTDESDDLEAGMDQQIEMQAKRMDVTFSDMGNPVSIRY